MSTSNVNTVGSEGKLQNDSHVTGPENSLESRQGGPRTSGRKSGDFDRTSATTESWEKPRLCVVNANGPTK